MRQQSFRHRGKQGGGFGSVVLAGLAVILGAVGIYYLVLWFRSSNEKTLASQERETDESVQLLADSRVPLERTALLKTLSGETAGTAARTGSEENPSYVLLANLVALPPEMFYEVWLVQDGLADVKSIGALQPRADGSWVGTFTAKDPLEYPTVVIMLEANDGNPGPSGKRVAEGKFE